MATYPGAIPNFLTLQDGVDTVVAAHPNDRAVEIVAIATELGTNPKGSCADVKTRLAVGINNDGTVKLVGSRVDKSANYGAQQAATDGWVIGSFTAPAGTSGIYAQGYTDANANPTTLQGELRGNATVDSGGVIPMLVKKGEYWKIVLTGSPTIKSIWWIPLGT